MAFYGAHSPRFCGTSDWQRAAFTIRSSDRRTRRGVYRQPGGDALEHRATVSLAILRASEGGQQIAAKLLGADPVVQQHREERFPGRVGGGCGATANSVHIAIAVVGCSLSWPGGGATRRLRGCLLERRGHGTLGGPTGVSI